MIKKVTGGYKLISEKTGKNLGVSKTKEGIEKRRKEVEMFKHMKKKK